jgi:hypothetical protein
MCVTTLADNPQQRSNASSDNSPLPMMADRLLFNLMYVRKAATLDIRTAAAHPNLATDTYTRLRWPGMRCFMDARGTGCLKRMNL